MKLPKFNHPFIERTDGYKNILKNGYVADKRIFGLAILLVVVIASYGWYLEGFAVKDHVYLHCPSDAIGGSCTNPLYGTCAAEYCQQEQLFAGYEYGTPPGNTTFYLGLLMVLVVLVAATVNHFLHNKDFEFGGEV
jgi:hypothetical protein